MNRTGTPDTVTSPRILIAQALADLEKARPNPYNGEIVSVVTSAWQDRFIMTRNYGWLRLPD